MYRRSRTNSAGEPHFDADHHLMVAFGVGFFGLVLWLPVVLVLHFTSIRPTHVAEDDITLTGVSQAVVEELQDRRRARPDERRGGRRRRRDRLDE